MVGGKGREKGKKGRKKEEMTISPSPIQTLSGPTRMREGKKKGGGRRKDHYFLTSLCPQPKG